MNDRQQPSVHDVLLMVLSDVVALERNMAHMTPVEVKRHLRSVTAQLSTFLPEVEAFDQLDNKVTQLERRMRILGISSGEDFE